MVALVPLGRPAEFPPNAVPPLAEYLPQPEWKQKASPLARRLGGLARNFERYA
jgi:hypothetical protein